MKRAVTQVRVRYPEVDSMGVAHHSHFLVWFEVGRTELMRGLGHPYASLEKEGVRLPVIEVECRYLAPARYDDLLEVETEVEEVAASRVSFKYLLRRAGGDPVLAEARTVHATVNQDGSVIRLPQPVRDILNRP